MAKHVHVHFAPRKRVTDQAPGSVPPSDLKPLVEALHAAIAARQGSTPTQDEQPRAANGQFGASSDDHEASVDRHRDEMKRKTTKHPDWQHHHQAAKEHGRAAEYLRKYQRTKNDVWKIAHRGAASRAAESEASIGKRTQDADFDESKIKRDEGGRFSAQQHEAAAASHKAEAEKHAASYKATNSPAAAAARNAHQEAADLHTTAASHVKAQTGWSSHNAQQAHNATAAAKQASAQAMGPASLDQLKAQASDPKASIEQRAAAVSQLSKMEKMANEVAASPHAIPDPAQIAMKMHAAGASPEAVGAATQAAVNAHPAAGRAAPQAQPSGDKPTSAKASGAKAATHELLSSGHPFSVDELMKATNCSNKTTLMTALSDLKSPKYAGKLGALNIVKRPDGMYHVQKDDGKPLGKAAADNPYGLDDGTRQKLAGLAPKIAAQQGAPKDKNAGPTKGSTLGPDMPGPKIPTPPGTSSGPSTGQRDPGAKFAGAMAANKGSSGSMESQAAKRSQSRLPTLNPYTKQPLSPEVQAKMAQEAPITRKRAGSTSPATVRGSA